jgi:hypothetical protein
MTLFCDILALRFSAFKRLSRRCNRLVHLGLVFPDRGRVYRSACGGSFRPLGRSDSSCTLNLCFFVFRVRDFGAKRPSGPLNDARNAQLRRIGRAGAASKICAADFYFAAYAHGRIWHVSSVDHVRSHGSDGGSKPTLRKLYNTSFVTQQRHRRSHFAVLHKRLARCANPRRISPIDGFLEASRNPRTSLPVTSEKHRIRGIDPHRLNCN